MILPFLNNKSFESKFSSTPEGWRLLVLLFVINILFFVTFAWLLPIRFETNDDISMILLASGKTTGNMEAHLVYINYILGLLIASAYKIYSKIEWYSLLFCIIHICSLTVIAWKILCNNSPKRIQLFFLLIIYVLEVRMILTFQFTTTTALAALAGLLLISNTSSIQRSIGSILFVVATMIRFEAAFLVLIVFSPYFLRGHPTIRKILYSKSVIILLFSILVAVGLKYIDYKSFQYSSEWNDFNTFKLNYDNIPDNPNAYTIINKLPIGLKYTDYEFLMKFLVDCKKVTLPTLKTINNEINTTDFITKIHHVYPTIRSYSHLLIFLFIACFLFLFYTNLRKNGLILLLSGLTFSFVLCYISFDGQFKYRVFISAILPLLFIFSDSSFTALKPFVINSIIFCLILFCVDFSTATLQIRTSHIKDKIIFTEQKCLINSFLLDTSNRVLPFYDRLSIENLNPFHVSDQMHFNQIINSGWMAYYPYNRRVFPSFKSFTEGLDLFISNKDTQIVSKLTLCLLDNYAITVKPIVVIQSPHYMIVQFKKE